MAELQLDTPAGPETPVFSDQDGFNWVTVMGSLVDPSIREMLDLKIDLRDDQDLQRSQRRRRRRRPMRR